MKPRWGLYFSVTLFVGVSTVLFVWQMPIEYLKGLISGHSFLSYVAFVAVLVIATVCMPITVLPLIPLVSPIFGPFLTGVLSIIGWTLGAAGAFVIARYWGRPVLGRFMSLAKLDRAVVSLPPETRFLTIVLLRMALPVDVISYALGLVEGVAFVPYIVATAIGVSYFSFAFAYLGDAVFAQNNRTVLILVGGSLVLFCACWGILVRHMQAHK